MIGADTVLQILGFIGLALAAFASAWAVLSEKTIHTVNGRKQPTFAGWVAIGLIAGGLLTNIVSALIKSRVDEMAALQRIARERLESLRLATSSQPLQSIRTRWTFKGLAPDAINGLKERMAEAENELSNDDVHKFLSEFDHADWVSSVERIEVIHAWFSFLATGSWRSAPDVVIRLPLYQSEAVVLPFGSLPLEQEQSETAGFPSGWNLDRQHLKNVSAGIDACEFVRADPANFDDEFLSRRGRLPAVFSSVKLNDGRLEIELSIDARSMHAALDRVSPQIIALAQLPQKAEVLVLADILGLPWPADNFSGPLRSTKVEYDDEPASFVEGTLEITPNNIDELTVKYKISAIGNGTVIELPGPEASDTAFCRVAGLMIERIQEAPNQRSK